MPLYEYECCQCNRVHEVMQKFSDPKLETCPECQGPVTKLMSMSSFSLKGTGWYTSDYKRKPSSGASSPKETESSKCSAPADSSAGGTCAATGNSCAGNSN